MTHVARLALVTVVSTLGVLLLMLLLVVRLGPVPGWWPLLAADTFALYAFLPFLGVATVALLCRSRVLAALSLAALLFFGHQYGGQLLGLASGPKTSVEAAGETRPRLRVLTVNLHAPNDDPVPFIALVRRVDPDVILFQEVTSAFEQAFDAQMGTAYPFSATFDTSHAHQGSGTWSRYPLLERELLRPTRVGNAMHRVLLSTGQETAQATGTGTIWLYNVHLPNPTGDNREDGKLAMLQRFNTQRRDFELRWLVEQTAAQDGAYILAGDFNIAAGSYGYRNFSPDWRDAHALTSRGLGHTFPAPSHEALGGGRVIIPFPLLRIDYVLSSPGVRPIRTWLEELPESDHLALVADLEL